MTVKDNFDMRSEREDAERDRLHDEFRRGVARGLELSALPFEDVVTELRRLKIKIELVKLEQP